MEIIVVDNGSTDKTVEEIREISGIKVIKNEANLGFAKAINQGLKEAKGEYLLLLNSDTVILDNAIDKEINFLKTHLEAGAVGCQLRNPDGSIQPSGGYLPNLLNIFYWMTFLDDLPFLKKILHPYHVQDKEFYTHQRYLGWITGAFLLTKREVVKKVGLLDEKIFMYVEEVDWCTRVNKSDWKIAFDPNVSILHYKGSSGNKSRAGIIEEFLGIKYYFSKHHSSWQISYLVPMLKLGSWLRFVLFGIIGKDEQIKTIYEQAFRMV